MKSAIIVKVAVCLTVFGMCLYCSIDEQNTLTRMRMRIPYITKELKGINEEIMRLQYEIDAFESPQHLLELSRQDAYAHLKYPFANHVLAMSSGKMIRVRESEEKYVAMSPKLPLATGAHR